MTSTSPSHPEEPRPRKRKRRATSRSRSGGEPPRRSTMPYGSMETTPLDYERLGLDEHHTRLMQKMGATSFEDAAGILVAQPEFTDLTLGAVLWERGQSLAQEENVALAFAPEPPPEVALGLALPPGYEPEPVSQALLLAEPPEPRDVPLGADPVSQDFSMLVDLRDRCRGIREQGLRPTCVGHACAAAGEMYFEDLELSPNYVFHSSKQRDGQPNVDGTWIEHAAPSLEVEGSCLEELWPYNPTILPGNPTHAPVPAAAVTDGNRRLSQPHQHRDLKPTGVSHRDWVIDALNNDQPVVVGLLAFPSWNSPETWRSGKFILPPEGSTSKAGHAMCIVGYGYSPTQFPADPEFFLVKNSWGERFGRQSPFQPGYGFIAADYIDKFGVEAAIISY